MSGSWSSQTPLETQREALRDLIVDFFLSDRFRGFDESFWDLQCDQKLRFADDLLEGLLYCLVLGSHDARIDCLQLGWIECAFEASILCGRIRGGKLLRIRSLHFFLDSLRDLLLDELSPFAHLGCLIPLLHEHIVQLFRAGLQLLDNMIAKVFSLVRTLRCGRNFHHELLEGWKLAGKL